MRNLNCVHKNCVSGQDNDCDDCVLKDTNGNYNTCKFCHGGIEGKCPHADDSPFNTNGECLARK